MPVTVSSPSRSVTRTPPSTGSRVMARGSPSRQPAGRSARQLGQVETNTGPWCPAARTLTVPSSPSTSQVSAPSVNRYGGTPRGARTR